MLRAKEHDISHKKKKKHKIIKCVVCGSEFVPHISTQITCDHDCQKIYRRIYTMSIRRLLNRCKNCEYKKKFLKMTKKKKNG